MKQWTREEVERLVPELAQFILCAPLTTVEQTLLQTCLDLETAKESNQEMRESQFAMNCEITRLRGALERIASNSCKEENAWLMAKIAREALKEEA